MYEFLAHYSKIDSVEEIIEITKMITIDMYVIDCQDEYKSAWKMAIDKALDLERKMNDNELEYITFDSIELLSLS